MNIILLVCDALRASGLGCYGNRKNLSPEIDKIAKKGMLFSNAFSAANATDSSFTTIFTGKYPTSHGIINQGAKITDVEKSYTDSLTVLPEILQRHGFVTIGIDWLGRWHKRGFDFYGSSSKHLRTREETSPVTDHNIKKKNSTAPKKSSRTQRSVPKKNRSGSSWPLAHYNWYYYLPPFARKYVRSFAYFYNKRLKTSSSKDSPVLTDSAGLSDLAIKYIERFAQKNPFFLFVHYWDNHIPYTAPKDMVDDLIAEYDYPDVKVASILKDLSGTTSEHIINKAVRGKIPETMKEIMAYYDASVKYVDSNIGRIYRSVEKKNILNDTLIIITSDHGESMTEHDIFFDHHGLYDPQIKVPLVIHNPNISSGSVYKEFVQHFDIMPTILDIENIDDVGYPLDGRSLLSLIKNKSWDRKFVFAEEANSQRKRMVRDEKFKYIKALDKMKCSYCQKYHSEGDEFYDLQADPGEKKNIIADERRLIYERALEQYIAGREGPAKSREVTFNDEEEVNSKLRALGYL